MIFSPVNDGPDRIMDVESSIRANSFFDPQFYIPASSRGKLPDYPFFPSTALPDYNTSDFETACWDIARACVEWQAKGNFSHIVIPTRYYDDLPSDYVGQISSCYIEPFLSAIEETGISKSILLTVIVKSVQVSDEENRNYLLNWLTSYENINGIYIIFENTMTGKQIKDPMYLAHCLYFIKVLKDNGLSVHIGYNNTEGLLYSLAGPDSISMGSYENLRKFNPSRFIEQDPQTKKQPNPRLYSGLLFQWIELNYIKAIQQLYPSWKILFENSRYTPLNFRPKEDWNLRQPELYKHFFIVFSKQAQELPENLIERGNYLRESIQRARQAFIEVDRSGVVLDDNSDGSHLSAWLTAMNIYASL